jgi:hypothetical protein
MLRLGLGDLDGAVADQALALEHARIAKGPQQLNHALAVSVHVHADTGRLASAREHFDELIGLGPDAFRHIGFAVGDIAWAALATDRARPARQALAAAEWPSFRAATALLADDHASAAMLYDAHGAARSATRARLRGGNPAELRRALEFFTHVRATRYGHECARRLTAEA